MSMGAPRTAICRTGSDLPGLFTNRPLPLMRRLKVTEILPARFSRIETAVNRRNKISQRAFFGLSRRSVAHSGACRGLGSSEGTQVQFEGSEPTLQPSMSERAMDTATDASRTIGEATANLRAAVERLTTALDEAQSEPLISTLRRTTRRAPLTSLFVAFLLGAALVRARRH